MPIPEFWLYTGWSHGSSHVPGSILPVRQSVVSRKTSENIGWLPGVDGDVELSSSFTCRATSGWQEMAGVGIDHRCPGWAQRFLPRCLSHREGLHSDEVLPKVRCLRQPPRLFLGAAAAVLQRTELGKKVHASCYLPTLGAQGTYCPETYCAKQATLRPRVYRPPYLVPAGC